MNRHGDKLSLLAACLAASLGGTMVVGIRYLVSEIDPITTAVFRLGLATLCLIPPALLTSGPRIARRDLVPIAALGIAFFTFFSAGLATALQYTTASRGGLIMAAIPILTLLVARGLGREMLTRSKILGSMLTLIGIGAVVGENVFGNGAETLRGEAIMLAMVLLAAVFNVLSRPYLQRYAQIKVLAVLMGSGWVVLAAFTFAAGWADPWPALSRTGWLSLVFLGTVAGALPMFLYHWALGRIEASQVSVTNGLSPLTAMLLGALLLAEPLSWRLGVGLILVLAGIYMTNQR